MLMGSATSLRTRAIVVLVCQLAATGTKTCDLQKTPLEVRIGGTLTDQWTEAQDERRGFDLLAAAVNNEGPFKNWEPPFCLQDGRPVRMKLNLLDDKGSAEQVKLLYEQMIANSTVDLFVAPHGSEFTQTAAEVTDSGNKILMAHYSPISTLYTDHGFRHVFTTDVVAENYMQDALQILHRQGATTLTAAWFSRNNDAGKIAQAVCASALDHAEKLGFDIVNTFEFGPVDLTSRIQETANERPDVFVGCSHLTDAINTVVTSRALGFSPKAFLLLNSDQQTFITAVGAPNANYIFAPVSWHQNMEEGSSDRVFRSANDFAALFRQMHKVEPTPRSASAAASGIALLAAVEELGASGPSDAIAAALRDLDMESFYGRLKFTSNGTLVNRSCITVQVQQLPDDRSPEDRYLISRSVVVSGSQAPMWPMPTWEQKELQVFPCAPGQVVNQTNVEYVSCEPCGIGRYRPQSSLACTDCGVGFYGDEKGLAQCKTCPEGADCGPSKVPGVPIAEPGFYKLPNATRYEPCEPGSLCLGNNKCRENHIGVMCAQCELGYTVKQANFAGSNKVCADCPLELTNMLLIFSCFVVYSTYITVLGYLTTASSSSVRAIHSIILKKIVNHVQLATTAWTASEFDDFLDLQVVSDLSQDPMRSFLSLDCLLKSRNMQEYKARIVIGLACVPSVLLLNFLFFTSLMLLRLRIFLKDAKVNKHIRARDQATAAARQEEKEVQGEGTDKDKDENEIPAEDMSDISEGSSTSSHVPLTSLQGRWRALQETMVHSLQWGIVWLFILHPMVVKMLLEGITCEEYDVMRLKNNLDTVCNTADHKTWFWLCLVGLAVYGLGIPLVNFILLYRVRHRLMQLSVRRIYGFLYNGFEGHWYYFEVVHMLRKVFILLFASIPVMYVRIVAMLCLSFAFLALHIFCNPYDNRDYFVLDKLETTSLLALILTLQVRLFFDLRKEIESSSPFVHEVTMNRFFDIVLWGCCIVCHAYFWMLAFYSLFRNSVMKLWHLKAECAPESLNYVQRLLLRFEPHMNRVKYDAKTHELDLSALGQKERHFLYVALCDTMECYIQTDRQFHPGRILTAVQHAIHMCVRDRSWRAQKLVHIMQTHGRQHKKGRLARLKHLVTELRHAMMPGSSKKDEHESTEKVSAAKKAARKRRKLMMLSLMEQSATVEELQNALMLCWPEILEHRPRFFTLKPPPSQAEQSSEAPTQDPNSSRPLEAVQVDPNTTSASDVDHADDEEVQLPKLSDEEVAEALQQAAQPMPMGTVVLRRRQGELTQEVWLLRAEVAALKQHLSAVEETTEATRPSRRHGMTLQAASASSTTPRGGTEQNRSSESDSKENGEDLIDGVFSAKDRARVLDQVTELVSRLRTKGYEADAAELRAMSARLLSMQTARVAATALAASAEANNSPPSAADHRQKSVEAKVIDSLGRGEGWQELGVFANQAWQTLSDMVFKLRRERMDWEANNLEALTKRLSMGLVTIHEASHDDVQLDYVGRSQGEAHGVEAHVMKFIDHLKSLRQNAEAEHLKKMATRLLAIDNIRHSSPGGVRGRRRLRNRKDPIESSQMAGGPGSDVASRVLASLQKDDNWHLMGPPAASAVRELAGLAVKLAEKGFEDEADAVTALIDDLCQNLIAENPQAAA